MSVQRPNLVLLRQVLDGLENPSEEYYPVPIPGTDIMAYTCEADQAADRFMEAFSPETCDALLKVVELADMMDCYSDCGNAEGRAECENPMCRALAAFELTYQEAGVE